jgi:hypothetical protein
MNIREYHQLQAERTALDRLISQLPSSSVIDRLSLESRKQEVEEEIAAQPTPVREPTHVRLTFHGKPVVESYGVFAEFGAAVVDKFANVVAAIGASQNVSLGTRGPIPKGEDYRLLITGTAIGSFGFELEEAPKGPSEQNMLFPEASLVESAIEQAKVIMEASLASDDELTDAISETDPRALETMRDFLKTMADQEAICALEFKGETFRFADVGQVRRSEERLRKENIHEEEEEIIGQFQGVLPKRRTFEFLVADTKEVISGKVGPGIENASEINHVLEKPLKIQVHTKRVGEGKPRYVLISYVAPSPLLEEKSSQGA